VTGVDDPRVADVALENGAFGYLVKPVRANELIINVASALRRRDLELKSRDHQEQLEQTVRERTGDLRQALHDLRHLEGDLYVSQEETVLRLARACEFRDDDTGQHVQRVSRYSSLIAKRLGFDHDRCEQIRLASMLHDVGKIAIPDSILLKAGPLTESETILMQRHAEIGYHILRDSKSKLMQLASTIALAHHEKFDGGGYPHGFTGSAIPIEGRIAAIADVFDALTTKRVYKPAYSPDRTIAIMREGNGKHFDPHLVDLFLNSMDEVQAIKERYRDRPAQTNRGIQRVAANCPPLNYFPALAHTHVVNSPHWN
jgi:putative two-component system response regulator